MLIEWNASMSMGVDLVDAEHRKIISFINRLYEALEDPKQSERVIETIDEVILFCARHFEMEERVFENTEYSDKSAHMNEHACIKQSLESIRSKVNSGEGIKNIEDIMLFLKGYIVNHICQYDIGYTKYRNKEVGV